eukprot:Skav228136  [mRNA]  locus=scaffold3237:22165:25167:+ [translate_table: standard]
MYNKRHSRATQKVRLDKAYTKLQKIGRQDADLEVKAQLISETALASALYGSHVYVVGLNTLQQLRTAMANALIGESHRANSYLVTMALLREIEDPEYWLIKKSLMNNRAFLFAVDADARTPFLLLASSHTTDAIKVYGPAGAFMNYISRLGWTLDSTGILHISAGLSVHICESDLRFLLQCLEYHWMSHVSQVGHERSEWRNAPIIDRPKNLATFAKVVPQHKLHLARELCGAYHTEDKIASFNQAEDGLCKVCGNPAGVEHQLLHCASTQTLRDKFPDVVQMLDEYDPIHMTFPHHFMPPDWDFRQALFHQTSLVQFSPDMQARLASMSQQGLVPTFFTDGSCQHPTDSHARLASYAIVLYAPDHPHMSLADLRPSKHFLVVGMGGCQGRQAINRAELQAVLCILEHTSEAHIYTDSQYVLKIMRVFQRHGNVTRLHRKPNFDLLLRVSAALLRGSFTFHKVKAHQKVTSGMTNEQVFLISGNEVADLTAKSAGARVTSYLSLPASAPLDRLISERTRHWEYLVELKFERAKLVQVQADEHDLQQPSNLTYLSWASMYNPQGPFWQPAVLDDDVANACTWGSHLRSHSNAGRSSGAPTLLDPSTSFFWTLPEDDAPGCGRWFLGM